MAREFKPYTHTTTGERLIKVVCDLCKKEAPHPDSPNDGRWGKVQESYRHDIGSVIVSCRLGENIFDAGGDYEQTFYDVCPSCFMNTIVPMLRKRGVEPQVKKVTW